MGRGEARLQRNGKLARPILHRISGTENYIFNQNTPSIPEAQIESASLESEEEEDRLEEVQENKATPAVGALFSFLQCII